MNYQKRTLTTDPICGQERHIHSAYARTTSATNNSFISGLLPGPVNDDYSVTPGLLPEPVTHNDRTFPGDGRVEAPKVQVALTRDTVYRVRLTT